MWAGVGEVFSAKMAGGAGEFWAEGGDVAGGVTGEAIGLVAGTDFWIILLDFGQGDRELLWQTWNRWKILYWPLWSVNCHIDDFNLWFRLHVGIGVVVGSDGIIVKTRLNSCVDRVWLEGG